MNFWCDTLVTPGSIARSVRLTTDDDGRISAVVHGAASAGDIRLGTVVPGFGNAHSHCFHRVLRGRTHAEGGDFWRWRDSIYAVAGLLDPQLYHETARAVFAEMLACGYTAVGEFHYLHHRPDGSPWPQPHAMELALARAATDVGIRLTLLDTAYLAGGIGQPLEPQQRAFSDGSAAAWLDRWHSLREALAGPEVTLGAAIHSVRAVPRGAITELLAGLPEHIPLHVHVSEQPLENEQCLAAYGMTPVELLHELGALSPRLSLVHATHVSESDRALIAASGATIVMCPTTEADLGDGIGPARELADAGTAIALGSDQNAVIDPWLELRALEYGERLRSGERGRFDPHELLAAATSAGYGSLGLGGHSLAVGDPCDLVEVATESIRTVGTAPSQLPLSATASDVTRVIVGGVVVVENGILSSGDRPHSLLRTVIATIERRGE